MYCHNCGNKVIGNYCSSCGTKINGENSFNTPTNWALEQNFDELIKYPEVRALVSAYAEKSSKSLSAKEFLGLVDLAFAPIGGLSLRKLTDVMVPVYQKSGISTGKSAKEKFNQSVQLVVVKCLCSLAINGYPLESSDKAINGLVLTAKIPSDMWTWGGNILITIEDFSSYTEVNIDAKIKGQLYDWGKSKGVIKKIFSDIENMQIAV